MYGIYIYIKSHKQIVTTSCVDRSMNVQGSLFLLLLTRLCTQFNKLVALCCVEKSLNVCTRISSQNLTISLLLHETIIQINRKMFHADETPKKQYNIFTITWYPKTLRAGVFLTSLPYYRSIPPMPYFSQFRTYRVII